MPRLEAKGVGIFDVEDGERIGVVIEEDAGVDVRQECGSYAGRTACGPSFWRAGGDDEGAELVAFVMLDLLVETRLSCKALCDRDMKTWMLMTVSSTGARVPVGSPGKPPISLSIWVEKPA